MDGHMILISPLTAQFASTYIAQISRFFVNGCHFNHIRWIDRVKGVTLTNMVETDVAVQSYEWFTPSATPTTPNWSQVFLVLDSVFVPHVTREFIKCHQINVAIVAVQVVSILSFIWIRTMDLWMLVYVNCTLENITTFITSDLRLRYLCGYRFFVNGKDVTTETTRCWNENVVNYR